METSFTPFIFMQLKLDLQQRVTLDDLIAGAPGGDRLYWKLARAAREVLSLSEKDFEHYGVKIIPLADGKASVQMKKNAESLEKKTYEVPDRLVFQIVSMLEEKDKSKTLNMAEGYLLDALPTDDAKEEKAA